MGRAMARRQSAPNSKGGSLWRSDNTTRMHLFICYSLTRSNNSSPLLLTLKLLKLYERSSAEGLENDTENIPADIIHHFLLAICTHRGIGICFADKGWYPPRIDTDPSSSLSDPPSTSITGKKGRVYNKILANIIKGLKVTDDLRQQELALRIVRACPELVASYLSSAGLVLEPRLSSKWIASVSFLGSVVSLPVPKECFHLPTGAIGSSSTGIPTQFNPTPPPLQNIIENILPSISNSFKPHVTKALQHASALVRHTAALTLARCLQKCESVLHEFRKVESALEEEAGGGEWGKRREEMEKEVRRRVPEFGVILAFANANRSGMMSSSDKRRGKENGRSNSATDARGSMMNELAERLIWLYHRCVPAMVAEARYDVGKSMQSFLEIADDENNHGPMEGGEEREMHGMDRLRELHVLKMLSENEQFVWNAKASELFFVLSPRLA
jgi:nucleolar pre-ribosomal-associated protein 1